MKPKDIDFKPRKTKAKGKGGTAKVIRTKKILKELSRRVSRNYYCTIYNLMSFDFKLKDVFTVCLRM